jgi:hypothetical protein
VGEGRRRGTPGRRLRAGGPRQAHEAQAAVAAAAGLEAHDAVAAGEGGPGQLLQGGDAVRCVQFAEAKHARVPDQPPGVACAVAQATLLHAGRRVAAAAVEIGLVVGGKRELAGREEAPVEPDEERGGSGRRREPSQRRSGGT